MAVGSSRAKPYLTAAELARMINVSTRTLRRYEAAGIGPAPFNLLDGGRTLYDAGQVLQWLEEEQAASAKRHAEARAETIERQHAKLAREDNDLPPAPRNSASTTKATARGFRPGAQRRETVRHPDDQFAAGFDPKSDAARFGPVT